MDKEKKAPSYINTKEKSPPPGSYDTIADLKYKSQGGASFGREKRPDIKKDSSPGPGHYKMRNTFTSDIPKYANVAQKEEFAEI